MLERGINMLINCPECNKEISDTAKSCPYCGHPIKNPLKIAKSKERAKTSTLITITYVVIWIAYEMTVASDKNASHAYYMTSGLGDYPRYLLIGELLEFVFFVLLIVTIVFWIIYFVNKSK